jgi:drug/metabolite transporter (DMT)-like permease
MNSSSRCANTTDLVPSAALPALIAGAVAIGASPIFVRLCETGPFAAAFWRVALALPLLYLWTAREEKTWNLRPPVTETRALILAGVLFAGDLIFWHLAIRHTTVANATLFANFSTVIVALGAWLLLGERLTARFGAGLGLALTGAAILSGATWKLNPDYLLGDAYGMVTALFFGGYILAVRAARARMSAAALMLWSGIVTALTLLAVTLAMGESLWPESWNGWAMLLALAWVSHAGGQGLIAYALGHLPAGFSSLVVLLEPLAAAVLGWLVLTETLTLQQAAGGAVILAGVMLARERRRRQQRHA